MLFDHIGIHGWDDIEPLILSAVLSDLSILLIGDIGSNKTEGSKAIAQALLHSDIEFRNYEVPTMNFDDLIGFVNPKHLSKGTLQFVPTPLSIWNADAVLFDEINRANPFIQSKLHELIRTRNLMGLPTNLKMVFSAVNPPEQNQSGYMDVALASRFVCIQVPSIASMKDHHIDKIINGNHEYRKSYDLKGIMDKAGKCHFKTEDINTVHVMCKQIARELTDTDVLFNGRQLKMMSKLILSGMALRYATEINRFSNTNAVTAYVISVIPEVQGIVRTNVNPGMIKGSIRSIVSGYTLNDPIIMAQSIEQLCDVDIVDSLAWVSAMKQLAQQEEDEKALRQAIDKIKSLTVKGVIEGELSETLIHNLVVQITYNTLLKEDAPIVHLTKRIEEIAASI